MKMRFIARMEFVNAQLVDRCLGQGANATANPKNSDKNCLFHGCPGARLSGNHFNFSSGQIML
jgi:hypothetical protein